MGEHSCNQEWRISKIETTLLLTTEYMQKQFDELKEVVSTGFEKVWDKIDDIIVHSDATYAKKAELQSLSDRLNSIDATKKSTSLWWIKNWWLVLVAAITWVFSLLIAIIK